MSKSVWTADDVAHFTAEDIAGMLPPDWAFRFVSLEAAMNFFYPDKSCVRLM
jgi:hypothetical protein